MRILVVGGAGYIGSLLAPVLLQFGHKVTVIDSFIHDQGQSLFSCVGFDRFEFLKGDCRDSKLIQELMRDKDVVYWLAAIVGYKNAGQDAAETNVAPVQGLVKILAPGQIVVYPTTNSGYQPGPGERVETDRMIGHTAYSRTKIAAEEILMDTGQAVSFRLAAVYGVSPRMRWDGLVNDMCLQAVACSEVGLYQPNAKRDVLEIGDAVKALMTPLDDWKMAGQVFNVGKENMTKLEICQKIKDFLPDFTWNIVESEDPEGRDFEVSYRKIIRWGFVPKTGFTEGIQRVIRAAQMEEGKSYHNG